jgi:nucleoside-diphosphate-sugar epimerase
MTKMALFGAAGAIGGSIAAALRAQGTPYRVVGRNRAALAAAFGADPLAEIATWNPDDPQSVRAAAAGADTIVYLVGVPYDQFKLHPVLMQQTLDGAIAAGVARLVLIGTVYPLGLPRSPRVTEDHPREPHTFKGRMRKEQEDRVLAADAAGRIRTTILRLPDFYGPHIERSLVADLFAAALAGRRAKLIGPIDTPHEFLFVPDVGPVVTALAAAERAYGRVWHLGGAGTITQRDLAARVYAACGRTPRVLVAGKTMLRLAGLFDPIMRELVEMNYLMTTPVIIDDTAIHGLLGEIKKTSYDDGIARTLAAMRENQAQASPHS